jgi:hypothetical protein
MLLRRSIGDDAANPIYIEAVRGIGYRLLGGRGAARHGSFWAPRRLRGMLRVQPRHHMKIRRRFA